MNLSPATVAEFEKDYGIDPILQTSVPFHEHPHLAYQRNTLERMAFKFAGKLRGATGWIGDVGSAAARVRSISSWIHCMCPQLQPGDAQRLQDGKRARASICTHKLEDCRCKTFDTLVFVHSAYYFPTYEFWKTKLSETTSKTAFVVGHTFTESVSFMPYGEGSYELDCTGDNVIVKMSARGNDHLYEHPPLLWDAGGIAGDHESSLEITRLAKMGSTYLWQVTLVDRPSSVTYSSNSHLSSMVDEKYRGPLQAPAQSLYQQTGLARNEIAAVTVDRLYGYGPILWTCREEVWIPVPRGAIDSVAFKLLGRPRSPATLADTIHWMKEAVSASRLPPDRQLAAATLGAGLAFCYNLRDELTVGQTAAYRYESWWKVHQQLYNLVPATRWTFARILVLLIVTFSIALAALIAFPEYHHITGLVLVLGWITLFVAFSLAGCCARYNQWRTLDTWSSTLFHSKRASSIATLAGVPTLTAFPTNPNLVAPLLPAPGTSMTIQPDPHPPRHPSVESSLVRVGGMVFSSPVPSAHRQSQAADIAAVTNRVLVPCTDVDPVAFAKFRSPDLQGRKELASIRVDEASEEDFYGWIKKFPRHQQLAFIKVYEKTLDTNPSKYCDDLFTKFEKDKINDRDKAAVHKPRVITAVADAIKVNVAPFISKLAAKVRKVWNGRSSRIYYCSGCTPDEIGAVIDDFANTHGGFDNLSGLTDDFSLYDSTLQNELLNSSREDYKANGMSARTLAWLMASKSKGISSHGVRVDHGRKKVVSGGTEKKVILGSGYPDTNLTGSIVNAYAHESGLPDGPYLMLVCGDDNLLLAPTSWLTQQVVDDLCGHLTKLGLQPTPIFSKNRWDWEFCSKLLWYATHPVTGETVTVLGPKVGRLLTRVGWNLSVPGAANFRGALLGLKQDCNHIPMLHEFIEIGLALSAGDKAVFGKEHQELKHVSQQFKGNELNMRFIRMRYAITEHHCVEFLAVLRAAQSLPIVLNFPWLEGMYQRDL